MSNNKNGLNVLVDGGAGYLGSILIECLLNRSEELGISKVYCYDNLLYKQDGIFHFANNPKFEFVYGDVRDYETLQKYLDIADVVFPLSALVGMPSCKKNPKMAEEVNHMHVKYVANNCNFGTKVIYCHTNSCYKSGSSELIDETGEIEPLSHYGRTKQAAEDEILKQNFISLRLATVFGTSYRFRKDLLVNDMTLRAATDRFVVLFEQHAKRNYIHVRDVVACLIKMMIDFDKYRGQVFNVGLSENYSKLELCQKIKQYVPEFVIKNDEYTSDPDKRNYIISNVKLNDTGFFPRYSLDDGIKELLRAYPILINSAHFTAYTNL